MPREADPLTWVVGAGGLLGSSVVSVAAGRGRALHRPEQPIPWGRPDTGARLADEARRMATLATADDRPWQVLWCAGAGVTGTGGAALDAERATFEQVLEALTRVEAPAGGSLFLASSAGGVYAGSTGAPFDEDSVAVPLAPYGHAKLALEAAADRFHQRSGVPVLVGRISNLYGPGQNLAKAQGLISHVVRSHLLGRPISIYVPLDTVRDNLFVTDCADLVWDAMDRLRSESGSGPVGRRTKVLASQQGITVGFLIAELARLLKRRPKVIFGDSALTAYQARDLRLRSRVWTDLDRRQLTPLPVGMRRTIDGLSLALARGTLR